MMGPMVDPRAGTRATDADLVDVAALLAAYHDRVPDPEDVDQQVAFGTSGHRGSSLKTSFNEHHILATTQAICDYRAGQGYDGPLFMGRDTHALSEPAWHLGARGAARQRRRGAGRQPRRVHPDPGGLARDPARQPRAGCRHRRRDRRHPLAQPAGRRRLQVQPAPRRPGRHRCHVGHRRPRQRADPGRTGGGEAGRRRVGCRALRLPGGVRRRPAGRARPRRDS